MIHIGLKAGRKLARADLNLSSRRHSKNVWSAINLESVPNHRWLVSQIVVLFQHVWLATALTRSRHRDPRCARFICLALEDCQDRLLNLKTQNINILGVRDADILARGSPDGGILLEFVSTGQKIVGSRLLKHFNVLIQRTRIRLNCINLFVSIVRPVYRRVRVVRTRLFVVACLV